MHLNRKLIFFWLAAVITVSSCKSKKQDQQEESQATEAKMVPAPSFNADSAYAYVAKQVSFGPRVPNTDAHRRCGDYLIATLKALGCQVTVQEFTATTYDNLKLNARNIIGSINPQAPKRIMLASHWDSRPFADQDSTNTNKVKPVMGANDGASGVGVLLEMARTIQQAGTKPSVGIDFILFDAEDWGNSEQARDEYGGFCLGSQYWAANKHKLDYAAYYGILLDMVGAKGATFLKEGNSMQYAPTVVNTVWETASKMGYNQYFVDTGQAGPAITDDHLPVNRVAKIPMIDIIHLNVGTGSFFEDWHTTGDGLDNIDPNTLKAVGQVLLQTLYNEQ
ncbi:peptidase M28-like protein [Larkinella arboricola]|uniref:Peptidase M28-like protein n=1 Tax=Larkinella arboricola TaxID=643671 RepID=A0A327X4K5_LARAB|nr:M28 family peptidase [Larkinella arboricola]RAJ97848.1 peptidase M28-like protein [Larkinella arboricola]